MKLLYEDFVGKSTRTQTTVDNALDQANEYLASSELDLVSVETLWVDHGLAKGVRVWFRSKAL